MDIEFETIALKPLHREYLTIAITKLDRDALVTGTTVETPDIRGTVIFDRTQNGGLCSYWSFEFFKWPCQY